MTAVASAFSSGSGSTYGGCSSSYGMVVLHLYFLCVSASLRSFFNQFNQMFPRRLRDARGGRLVRVQLDRDPARVADVAQRGEDRAEVDHAFAGAQMLVDVVVA